MHRPKTVNALPGEAIGAEAPPFEETARMDSGSVDCGSTRGGIGSVVWRHTRTPLGMIVLALGAVGIVVPVIPGVPLLIAGIALLGQSHPVVRACVTWMSRCRARMGHRLFSRGRDLPGIEAPRGDDR